MRVVINYRGIDGFESVELTGELAKSFDIEPHWVSFDIGPALRAIPRNRIYDVLVFEENDE